MPSRRAALLLILLSVPAFCQTLARPGWAGSGMSANPWWKHAIIYQSNPSSFSNIQGITKRLDHIHSLGSDALLLTPLQPDPAHAETIDPALGTLDDLDDLIHQASRNNIRVLLELDPRTPNLTAVARFWLTRGIAGFHLTSTSSTTSQLADLRKLINTFVGQRILITDLASTPDQPKPTSPQLLLDPAPGTQAQLTATTIRPAIDASQDILQSNRGIPVLLTDGPSYKRSFTRYADGTHDLEIAKILATILLTTRSAALIYHGQELGLSADSDPATAIHWDAPPAPAKGKTAPPPDPANPNVALQDADSRSLLNWYRQLSALHHSNPTINSGANITLNHDDQNVLVWVRKPQSVTAISPAIVIICNLSPQPAQLSLKGDMQGLHLKGSFLRAILRSDNATGPMHLEAMTIPAYGVYIGELRY
jgi:Alpha amylase, catalytic domain